MLSVVLTLLSLIFGIAAGHVNSDVAGVYCKGEVKLDQLLIEKLEDRFSPASAKFDIPESCTSLEIIAENGSGINWEKIEQVPLPNLKIFKLYLTGNNYAEADFIWNKISLFGYSPKKITQLGLDLFLYYNNQNILNFDAPFKYLSIRTMNSPNSVLNTFSSQDVQLKTVFIADAKINNLDFTPPGGVTTLILDNVAITNMPGFIQKITSLEDLTLQNIREKIDVGQFIQHSKYLKSLTLENSVLTLEDSTHESESLKTLSLTACVLEMSFRENAWKVLPNLATLKYSGMHERIDLTDILIFKQLTHISLAGVSLIFTNPNMMQYKTLQTLELTSVEFDPTNLPEVVSTTFPNLTFLSVDSALGGTKPTKELLNQILVSLPDIQRLAMDPFEIERLSDHKGTFEIIYRYNPLAAE